MCIRINSSSLPLCLPPISQPEERKVEFKIFTVVAQVFRPEKLTFWGMIQFRFPFIFFQPVVKTAHQLLVKLLFESRFRRVIEISSANTTESLSFLSFLSFDQRTEISTLTCENTFLHLFKKKKKHRTHASSRRSWTNAIRNQVSKFFGNFVFVRGKF